MTIEDPIEFLHRDNRSIVNQREVGVDTQSFAHALRSALRQDPDVILVGEMRDLRDDRDGAARRRNRPPRVLDAAHPRRHRNHQPHHRGVPAAPAEADPAAAGQRAQGGRLAAPDAASRRKGPRARRRSDDHHAVHPRLHRGQGKDAPDSRRHRAGTSQYGMQTFDQSIFSLFEQGLVSLRGSAALGDRTWTSSS